MKKIVACQECKRQWDVTRYQVGQKLRCVCNFVIEVPARKSYAPEVNHCEKCGAARESAAGACQFCGATPTRDAANLSLVCPHCLHRTGANSRFCSFYGKEIHAAELNAKTGRLVCPRCKSARLLNRQIGAFTVDECPDCSGLWIESTAFDRLVKQQTEREKENVASASRRGPTRSQISGVVVYLKCPDCQQMMNRFNFAKASGVIIDECHEHGLWLDSDEFGKIAAYIASGGLQHTKKLEELDARAERARAGTAPVPFPAMNQFPDIDSRSSSHSGLGSILSFVVDLL